MKKLFALILALLMIFALTACSEEEEGEEDLKDYLVKEEVVDSITLENGDTFYFDLIDSETVTVTGFTGNDKAHAVAIPETLDGKTVVAISDEAFYGCSKLNAITIPATVTNIGAYAFARCEMLTTVTVPDTVTSLGEAAFYGCKALTSVTIGSGISALEAYTFLECTSLTTVTVPATIKTIAHGVFFGCTALESAVIAEGCEIIGFAAFQNCTALNALTLPASVVSIGNLAFAGNDSLFAEGITLPEGNVTCEAYKYITETLKPENKPVEETPAA